jgi:hypothetical protein
MPHVLKAIQSTNAALNVMAVSFLVNRMTAENGNIATLDVVSLPRLDRPGWCGGAGGRVDQAALFARSGPLENARAVKSDFRDARAAGKERPVGASGGQRACLVCQRARAS